MKRLLVVAIVCTPFLANAGHGYPAGQIRKGAELMDNRLGMTVEPFKRVDKRRNVIVIEQHYDLVKVCAMGFSKSPKWTLRTNVIFKKRLTYTGEHMVIPEFDKEALNPSTCKLTEVK